jgi:hypothetical protein
MKQYYQRDAESDLGEGVVYLEVTDEWPTRQVEIYGDTWRWADEKHNEWLADQPLHVLGLDTADQIASDKFEQVWREALRRCPPSS